MVIDAFRTWELEKRIGKANPLVLAFTGPTGVGKSETASQIASLILLPQQRVANTLHYRPNGLLAFRGNDYTEDSEILSHGISFAKKVIRDQLFDHISKCAGNAVVIFDEVQKFTEGVLDVLLPALDNRGVIRASVDVNSKTPHIMKEYSTSNTVFIFISDIGSENMTKLLIAHENRTSIPVNMLRTTIKVELDKQWERLHLGKVSDSSTYPI